MRAKAGRRKRLVKLAAVLGIPAVAAAVLMLTFNPPKVKAQQTPAPLTRAALFDDPKLQGIIEIHAEDASLSQVVQQVQAATGVPLMIGIEVSGDVKRLTAHLKAPAWRVLTSLSDPYQLVWVKADSGYALRADTTAPQDALQADAAKLPSWVGQRQMVELEWVALVQGVAKQVEEVMQAQGVKPEEGIAVSALPASVQAELRRLLLVRGSLRTLERLRQTMAEPCAMTAVRIRPQQLPGLLQSVRSLEVIGRDGKVILSLPLP